jgi:hypothetical protein
MTKPLAFALALALAAPALAQATGATGGDGAIAEILRTGVVGAFLILVLLDRIKIAKENKDLVAANVMQHEKHQVALMGVAVEQSRLLTENNLVARRQVELMEKVLERDRSKS